MMAPQGPLGKDMVTSLDPNRITEEGGTMFTFEGKDSRCHLKSKLEIHSPQFYWKVMTQADLGLADAYINGDFSFVDKETGLLNLIMILIASKELNSNLAKKRGRWTPMFLTTGLASAKHFLKHFYRQNNLTQARRSISRHYDLSNELFAIFLDDTMSYSSAVFKSVDEDLKAAQMRKIYLLIDKARIEKNHEVLDIGCGWGTLAIEAVRRTGCKYTGITLSIEQLKYAEEKVKQAGLQDRITLKLCDYRQLSDARKYDRIISCEMLEHVGHKFIETFFSHCEAALAEDGIFVLQFISIPEERYNEYRLSSDFIKEYIFPGGCLPSLARVTSAMASSSRLCIENVENIGIHYYQTLRLWRKNFLDRQKQIMDLGFDDRFIRTWEYYFDYCAAGFKTRTLGDYQIVFSRPGNVVAFGQDGSCTRILEEGETMFIFGEKDSTCPLKSILKIHSPQFYWKVMTQADLGLADAYINGDFSFVDKDSGLLNLIMILIANRDQSSPKSNLAKKRGWWTPMFLTAGLASATYYLKHVCRKNTLTQARRNISRHYDLSNEFFGLFMDDTMMYSAAIFKSENEDPRTAQMRKISLLIEKARIEKNHEVLEMGCGWGTLALLYLLNSLNMQKQKLKKLDFSEMIEAVGHEFMDKFFSCCEAALAENGIFVLQFTAIPEELYDECRLTSGFITEYIFPGGCLPSLARVTSAMATSSRLCIENVENIGIHSYHTLRCWRKNFLERQKQIIDLGFDDKFIRTWEYYFDYCAAGFKTLTLRSYQIVFSRPGNEAAFGNDDPFRSSFSTQKKQR
ncbi:unnamed protein product [Arabidopsis arenosa]|uniref:Cyclopropane-fatty-acyl-phospholipid synthase n=1 Tax=Arabidopsis arenosa TaxID=38785 RepID=A0A8S1ZWZ2_ARAAE|nr:unnamed protein product [Arabidopsis arenosa]